MLSRSPIRYLLRHTFSGASLTPSDQGPSLTVDSGTPIVSGGALTKTVSGNSGVRVDSLAVNAVIQAKVNFGGSSGSDRRAFLRLRDGGATGNRYEAALLRSGTTGLQINRRDNNAATQLGFSAFGVVDNTDYWVRFVVRGSTFEAFSSTDGVTFTSRLVVTDSTYLYSGIAVILIDNAVSPTLQVDDLLVWTP